VAEQIATITIPCLVLRLNNIDFINYGGELVVGRVLQVPCRNVLFDNTDGWAIPIKDNGIFTAFEMVHKAGDFLSQPTFDSIPVFRVEDKLSNSWWWIYGNKANFLQSSSTCCGDSPIPMPGTSSSVDLLVAPCQTLDNTYVDTSGNRKAVFALEALGAGQKYYPYGGYNNVTFTAGSSSGYDLAGLEAFLQVSWSSPSTSPAVTIAWAFVTDSNGITTVTATVTGSTWGDQLCVNFSLIAPSA
jgi:hypothetical protein